MTLTNKVPNSANKMPDTIDKVPDSANKVPDTMKKVPDSANRVPDTMEKMSDNGQEQKIYKYVSENDSITTVETAELLDVK